MNDDPLTPPPTTADTPYDRVPYGTLAFALTHPDNLATIARVFGVAAPAVARCRVLELGCASGGNLIPMAFNLPHATFVGVDLARRHVEEARTTIATLELRNLTIEHASILDVDAGWGLFDYIICHGVFSWVEPHVRDAILRIASENLAASGVAYISYNTYPGWHLRESVRDMMRFHARRFDEPSEQIAQARELIDFLTAAVSPDDDAYARLLGAELERVRSSTDWYLFHEHLEQTNVPLYFHQFMALAERAGLQYLAESDLTSIFSNRFPPAVGETLERVSPDILHLEQYMDFVRNRQFRQTLLCHASLRLQRALTASILHGCLAACRVPRDPAGIDLTPGVPVSFEYEGRRIEVTAPWTKAALVALLESWPRSVPVDLLCDAALARVGMSAAADTDHRRSLMIELFQCFVAGLVELHAYEPNVSPLSPYPRVNPLAAHQAQGGSVVVNPRHETIRVDDLTRMAIQVADGSRTRDEILQHLVHRAEDGGLTVCVDDQPVTERVRLQTVLSPMVDKALTSLARTGLLVDSSDPGLEDGAV